MSPDDDVVIVPEVVEALVENHRELLAFVERRVGSRATAEDILQDAFVKSIARQDEIRESAIGWWYRVLRNATVDQQRRQASATRRLEQLAHELEAVEAGSEIERTACQCVTRLAATLKPELASALQRIEVDGVAVRDYADEAGITANHAGVRVFRAREALRKRVTQSCGTCAEHGCLDCTCGGGP